ncbi:MAG: M20/M25/M40 family metallo-hydrolase [Candidatus Micrarchaeota archaeon]|nr:M20/M25/M40 family metallo-hydrolase [Candidatus Micrarchaeota archaeon]
MLKPAELAKALVSIQSFSNNADIAAYLAKLLEENGQKVRLIEKGDTVNVVCEVGKGKTSVLFNGHTDTVPPAIGATNAINGTVKDGVLSGLGVVDMKSGVAAMTCAFLELVQQPERLGGKVILVLVGNEEKGGENGTAATVSEGILADYVVIGEPTNLKICNGQKSALQLELSTDGVSRHAGRLRPNENAITNLTKAISMLENEFPVPNGDDQFVFDKITMNVGTILGGTAVNVVPAKCVSLLDFRFSPLVSCDEMLARVSRRLNGSVASSEKFRAVGWTLDKNSDFCKAAVSALNSVNLLPEFIYKFGSNDARFYIEKGCSVVNIGPGNNLLSHTGKEEIETVQIEKAKEVYVQLAKQLLTNGG